MRSERFHSAFEVLEVHGGERLGAQLPMHFVELPKVPPRGGPRSGEGLLEDRGRVFTARGDQGLEELAMSSPVLARAKGALDFLSAQPDAQDMLHRRRLAASGAWAVVTPAYCSGFAQPAPLPTVLWCRALRGIALISSSVAPVHEGDLLAGKGRSSVGSARGACRNCSRPTATAPPGHVPLRRRRGPVRASCRPALVSCLRIHQPLGGERGNRYASVGSFGTRPPGSLCTTRAKHPPNMSRYASGVVDQPCGPIQTGSGRERGSRCTQATSMHFCPRRAAGSLAAVAPEAVRPRQRNNRTGNGSALAEACSGRRRPCRRGKLEAATMGSMSTRIRPGAPVRSPARAWDWWSLHGGAKGLAGRRLDLLPAREHALAQIPHDARSVRLRQPSDVAPVMPGDRSERRLPCTKHVAAPARRSGGSLPARAARQPAALRRATCPTTAGRCRGRGRTHAFSAGAAARSTAGRSAPAPP